MKLSNIRDGQGATKARVETLSLTEYGKDGWLEVRPIWASIAECSPNSSFFLQAAWVDCWLQCCSAGLDVRILVFRAGDDPVGVCLLARDTARRGPFRIRRVYLNATGEKREDDACIEFNNLLCVAGWEVPMARRLAAHLSQWKWDEVVLNGFASGVGLEAILQSFDQCQAVRRQRPSYLVDLDAVRRAGVGYTSMIGQSTRQNVRQNCRLYQGRGELVANPARTAEEALTFLEELIELHQRSWNLRGKPGSFASKRFTEFQRALIGCTFDSGGTQVLRVSAGDVIGLLYIFMYRGKAYFYQSGVHYSSDKRLRSEERRVGNA